MRQLTIALFVVLVAIALRLIFMVQPSRVMQSIENQREFERQIKDGVTYSTNPKVHLEDGLHYLGVGDYEDAQFAFEEAIKLKPDFREAHYHLGFVYHKLGNRNEALKEYEILKNLDSQLAQKLLDLINQN